MNDNDDAAYYLSRAEQEDEAARRAINSIAASIHRNLASRYRSKAEDFEHFEKLNLARDWT